MPANRHETGRSAKFGDARSAEASGCIPGAFMTGAKSKGLSLLSGGPDTAIPEVQLQLNGRYHVMVTSGGGGYSRWKNLAVTRWREDAACDNWGAFCYIRDVASGHLWSTTHQPTLQRADTYEAAFATGRATFRRRDRDVETHTEIAVSPEDDVELRRVRITNGSTARKVLDVTSYAEIVLAPPATDAAHPAFSKLFVETELLRERQAILCSRRPRAPDEPTPWLFHLLTTPKSTREDVSYETDRMRFIGRGRTTSDPQALDDNAALSGSAGPVLDPVAAIRCRITLAPGETAIVDLISGFSETREACVGLFGKYRDPQTADRDCGSRSRCDADTAPGDPKQATSHRNGRATLRAPCQFCPLCQRFAARRPERSCQESPGPVESMGLRDFRRFTDRAAVDCRPNEHRSGAPSRTGPRVLAPTRIGRGPHDPQRGSR